MKVIALAFMACMALAASTEDVDWKKVDAIMADLQSKVAKRNQHLAKILAKDLVKELGSDQTTYYVGVSAGKETTLTAGAAQDVVGSEYHLRVNALTRASGEYLHMDRWIPGLSLFLTGEDTIDNLLEFGYSYRFSPRGERPIYAHASSVPARAQKGDGTYQREFAHVYAGYTENYAVAMDPTKVNLEELSKYVPVNVIHADRTTSTVNGREVPILNVKAHYVVLKGGSTLVWGDPKNCEKCPAEKQDFH